MPFSPARKVFIAFTSLFLSLCTVAAQNLDCIVIDAGHGGHDSGALSSDGRLKEKNVVLDIALRLGSKIEAEYEDVTVCYTRDKDEFIPLEQRSDIANKKHADLFISIHCNSVPKGKTAPSGCETFVMGMNKNEANMEVCKTENSVILLEEDYSTKYQGYDPDDSESFIFFNLMQNAYFEQSLIMADLCQQELHKGPITNNRGIKQGGLLVLWQTTMPSVLVELGFITNSSDRSVLASETKRDMLASDLFHAFVRFKEQYDLSVTSESRRQPTASPAAQETGTAAQSNPEEKIGSAAEGSKATAAERNQIAEPSAAEESRHTEQKANAAAADGNHNAEQQTGKATAEGYYTVQILAGAKKLPTNSSEFKGEKDIICHRVGNTYKYSVGTFNTVEDANACRVRINKKFPGCFVVHSSKYSF